jgi:hypothetical protein
MITFAKWLEQVDSHVKRLCGMSYDDIDDYHYNLDYSQGVSPLVAAKRAIKSAKNACGLN